MDLIADTLLISGALGAGFYCFILARRLNRFNSLEKGVGGAVALLSSQVDGLNQSLETARTVSATSSKSLKDLTQRAEDVAGRLELIMASFHDFPGQHANGTSAAFHHPDQAEIPVFVRHRESTVTQ